MQNSPAASRSVSLLHHVLFGSQKESITDNHASIPYTSLPKVLEMCLRRAFFGYWPSRSGRVTKTTPLRDTPSQISSPGRRGHPPRTPTTNTRDAGPRMLELFVQLYSRSIEIQRLESTCREHRDALRIWSFYKDRNTTELARLSKIPWANTN